MPEKSDPANADRIKLLEQNVADREAKGKADAANADLSRKDKENRAERNKREIAALKAQIEAIRKQDKE